MLSPVLNKCIQAVIAETPEENPIASLPPSKTANVFSASSLVGFWALE